MDNQYSQQQYSMQRSPYQHGGSGGGMGGQTPMGYVPKMYSDPQENRYFNAAPNRDRLVRSMGNGRFSASVPGYAPGYAGMTDKVLGAGLGNIARHDGWYGPRI